jgi:hypothetical protein
VLYYHHILLDFPRFASKWRHSLSDWFIDDVRNEVEVVTSDSEMQPRSDSEDVQPVKLGTYVGIRLGYTFRL